MPLRSVGTGGYLRSSRKGFGPGFGQGVKATMNQTRPDSWYQWLLSICADSLPDNNARMIRDKESYDGNQAGCDLSKTGSKHDGKTQNWRKTLISVLWNFSGKPEAREIFSVSL
ncbi:hypothetical protein F2Q69_00059568 [Brassica cretica]|uniref:Uncharacterized protein n=1 Tax=Brassica cretica TaxID=69181 RepID=A0A8S9RCI3_BRACR|nr:hypothetical protein F2Q69_00059568 [Brassica cretica]